MLPVVHQCDVHVAARHRLVAVVRGHLAQLEVQLGCCGAQRAQRRGRDAADGRGEAGHAQGPRQVPVQLLQTGLGGLAGCPDGLGGVDEDQGGVGQRDPATHGLEQAGPDLALELSDLLADRGGGVPEGPGRSPHRTVHVDGMQVGKT